MKFLSASGVTRLVSDLKSRFQAKLVSGTNIKTVNGSSLLGSGDVEVSGTPSTWWGTSSTSASTAEKVVACEGFSLAKGAVISVLFSTANTAAAPTLNVNSTGAKRVYVGTSLPNSTTNTLKWSANTILTFAYDGTYFRYLSARTPGGTISPDGAGSWYGTSSSAATSSYKDTTIANFRLTPGARVTVSFTNANTYTSGVLSLNVNSTGDKQIYVDGAKTSTTNTLLWDAGETLTFVYSGTYYCFVGRSKAPSGGSGGGGFLVTITDQYPNYVMDKTLGEIKAAVANGVCPIFHFVPDNYWGTLAYIRSYNSGASVNIFDSGDVPMSYSAASDTDYPHRMGGGNN